MSLRAYQQAAQRSETPRDAEHRLFAQVTRALIEVSARPREQLGAWMDALDWNRRMWSALAVDCARADNALPEPTRARIISLSLWVGRYTSQVMRGQEDIEALIEVNRMMMQGLSSRPEPARA
ncbi:MAG TPA: flagellar biosynthesis regulator FlaF [Caulobacteraceae bacterium]|nr:flagellar biosynthesis regulator FlaF [Caulobacteraceae bacterium]